MHLSLSREMAQHINLLHIELESVSKIHRSVGQSVPISVVEKLHYLAENEKYSE